MKIIIFPVNKLSWNIKYVKQKPTTLNIDHSALIQICKFGYIVNSFTSQIEKYVKDVINNQYCNDIMKQFLMQNEFISCDEVQAQKLLSIHKYTSTDYPKFVCWWIIVNKTFRKVIVLLILHRFQTVSEHIDIWHFVDSFLFIFRSSYLLFSNLIHKFT